MIQKRYLPEFFAISIIALGTWMVKDFTKSDIITYIFILATCILFIIHKREVLRDEADGRNRTE